jgi:hypothetical protein
MEKLVAALLVCPWKEQVTVAVPPVPFDSMCQDHPTTPLAADRLRRPVE